MNDALLQLATRHGVAAEFDDVWGKRRQVPAESLRAILAAMGVQASDEASAAAALRASDDPGASRRIAPLVVLRENARPWTLELRVPRSLAGAALQALVVEEDGHRHPALAVAVARNPAGEQSDGTHVALDVALAVALPPGYHDVSLLAEGEVIARTCCAVAPAACYAPDSAAEGRTWGAAVQLYGVQSARNWGIGDFTDLAALIGQWGGRGAGIVGLNPIHALYPHAPQHASPYSPSSRLFLNTLLIDAEAVAEFAECADVQKLVHSASFRDTVGRLRDAPQVDYPGVAAIKHQVLERLCRHFREHHLARDDARAHAFRAYVEAGGAALRQHALFEALQEHFHAQDPAVWGWPAWPPAYRDPGSPSVAGFAATHAHRVEYFLYLQWLAEQQLAAASGRGKAAGLTIGIFTDLAVSIDRGGAEAWSHQTHYALGVSVGAPPDTYNMHGQDWGLPPILPGRLRDDAYAPFLATLRANMRHAGALRIDHVMGLARQYWVPNGSEPAAGAYVHYPFDDLLGLLALESHRHRCMVIGEDLGTVPDYVRAALAANGILSYRVLIFERDGSGNFTLPAAYPAEALVTASTHDLPTLAGWWEGADIELRDTQGLLPSAADRVAQTAERAQDRERLLRALEQARVLPAELASQRGSELASNRPALDPALARSVQAYLAATPSRLLLVQLEDVLGVREQANLPGTTDSHPNWQRKIPLPLERWPGDERFAALAEILRAARPRPSAREEAFDRTVAGHLPRATYRIQLNSEFGFADAAALVPYFAALGVSHVYCSPYLRARPGSTHGYDVVDHSAIDPSLGTMEDFERFVAALAAHDMGHLCDVVPNHVGVMGADNAWWMDVLEHGQASAYADFFDIEWSPLDPDLAGKLLVPVLGDPYGVVLERAELRLTFEGDAGVFAVWYFDHRFPLDPREYPTLLAPAFDEVRGELEPDVAAAGARLLSALSALPARAVGTADAIAVRQRDSAAAKDELARLVARQPRLLDAIAATVQEVNGTTGEARSFERLHALLEAQAFRLAHWRVASDEINYRRFFDVNDLAALRMENEAVFDATHGFILRLAAAGKISGLRIDHPDGLFDPQQYFERLQRRYRQLVRAAAPAAPTQILPLYVVLEKIAASHERIPDTWPVHGTTGYRFANLVNGLFVATQAKARLDRAWRSFVGDEARDYETSVYRSKLATMRGPLAAELTMLAHRALRVARGDRRTRDFTYNVLRGAIAEIVAQFPVYRTYLAEGPPSPSDRRYVEWAFTRALRASRAADRSVYEFLRALLLADPADAGTDAGRQAEYRAFARRFQQFTSPVTAKSVEDTAFYTFNRLVSLNDVGGEPETFGITVRAFHGASRDRATGWPATMLATSTHDNKRSEDVRARIDAISEMPAAWRLMVRRWSRLNRSRKRQVDGDPAPSRNDEYLLYQTLLGTFPLGEVPAAALDVYRERIRQYMVKAVRESKAHTSWLAVNTKYEEALEAFIDALLASTGTHRFVDELRTQCAPFAWFGMLNSLSMALLKFASPGVPDLYQGNELFDPRLVDPDNRAAIDYELRRGCLAQLDTLARTSGPALTDAMASWFDPADPGRAKLWITMRLLRFRAEHPAILVAGDYLPVTATGMRADNVVAFARRAGDHGAIAVAGRLFASLGVAADTLPLGETAWGDTALDLSVIPPGSAVTNVLTAEVIDVGAGTVPMARLFQHFPSALLHYAPAAAGATPRAPEREASTSGNTPPA